jgi:carbon storage regulator CsrA
MLILARKLDEDIVINGNIVIKVIEIRRDRVRLGIEAPKELSIHRAETMGRYRDDGWRGERDHPDRRRQP